MNYRELNSVIMELSEEELKNLLAKERRGEKRRTFMIRVHQRLCALRMQREREEIENVCSTNA